MKNKRYLKRKKSAKKVWGEKLSMALANAIVAIMPTITIGFTSREMTEDEVQEIEDLIPERKEGESIVYTAKKKEQ